MAEPSRVENELRELLDKSKLPDYKVAELAGMTQPFISRFKRGHRGLTPRSIEALADVLGYELRLVKKKRRSK